MSYMVPDNVGRLAALRVGANHQTSIMASFAIDIARPGDYAISDEAFSGCRGHGLSNDSVVAWF